MARSRILRVCILTETYLPVIGGGETQARLLAEGLTEQGAAVCVLTRRSDRAFLPVERYGPVEVHRLGPAGPGQFKKWGLLLTCGPRLLRLRHRYDAVLVSGFRIIGPAAVAVARLLGKSVVLKADSQGEMSGSFFSAGLAKAGLSPSFPVFRLFIGLRNRILRRADAFVAITPDVEDELAAAQIPASKVRRIPNGVDTIRFRPPSPEDKAMLRRRLGLAEEDRVAVYTGRLVSYKGLPTLLAAWPGILAAQPRARLLLVGTGGLDIHNCEDELRAQVRQQGLEDSVRFIGGVEDVSPYLQAADVFAFPTENDAFPSSVVEAMACGLAVLTTPVGALPTVVRNGDNGIMVRPGDAQGLGEALSKLLGDPSLGSRLGEAARRSVLEQYSAEVVTAGYAILFRELESQRGPDR